MGPKLKKAELCNIRGERCLSVSTRFSVITKVEKSVLIKRWLKKNKVFLEVKIAAMLLLVKCYDNKMVRLPGVSYVGKPHMQLTNKNKIIQQKNLGPMMTT